MGIGLAANAVAGFMARIVGGTISDSPRVGRRNTLVLASAILGVGSIVMGVVQDFSWFITGNIILGLGVGLYWPAAEAMIADITTVANRRKAFAINRVADSAGLGIGVVVAGLFIQMSGAYRTLFFIDAASYFVLTAVIFLAISETKHVGTHSSSLWKSWLAAIKNPLLQLYVVANILMTSYITQISSSLPLYFSDSVRTGTGQASLSPWLLSSLFTIHVFVVAISQMPMMKALSRFSAANSLIISCLLWLVGFVFIAACGFMTQHQFLSAALGLIIMSIAVGAYQPPSAAIVAELSPPDALAIYYSINSSCWAIGGMIGPPLVLGAMDKFPQHTPYIWVVMSLSTLIPATAFYILERKLLKKNALV